MRWRLRNASRQIQFTVGDRERTTVHGMRSTLRDWMAERTRAEVLDIFAEYEAPVGPVYDMADIFEDEQYAARDDIVEMDDEDLGSLRTAAPVPRLTRTPGTVDHAGPGHGQHNDEVYLAELGLDEAEYERLREEGVI